MIHDVKTSLEKIREGRKLIRASKGIVIKQSIWNKNDYYFCIKLLSHLINLEKCIIRCCVEHGIPKECLEEQDETKSVFHYNYTHKVITMVHSDKCLNYNSIMKSCKMECIENTLQNTEIIGTIGGSNIV